MGPDDPLGTVRAGNDTLAVRAHNSDPDSAELSWFVIDIGGDIHPDDVVELLPVWPIVYQP